MFEQWFWSFLIIKSCVCLYVLEIQKISKWYLGPNIWSCCSFEKQKALCGQLSGYVDLSLKWQTLETVLLEWLPEEDFSLLFFSFSFFFFKLWPLFILLHLFIIVNISQTYWCVNQVLENFMDTEQAVFICFWFCILDLGYTFEKPLFFSLRKNSSDVETCSGANFSDTQL